VSCPWLIWSGLARSSSILLQYCRGVRKETFSNVESVIMSELIKMCLSVVLMCWLPEASSSPLPGAPPGTKRAPWHYKLLSLLRNSKKVIVLVVLYSVSNLCSLTAVEFIGAPMFTVVCQMKIFTTAAFGVLLLKKTYSAAKWRALLLLVIGCLMVSSPILRALTEPPSSSGGGGGGDMYGHSLSEQLYGLAAVTLQVSG
jgi:drug/metabolite transporter (DMT)-like permease